MLFFSFEFLDYFLIDCIDKESTSKRSKKTKPFRAQTISIDKVSNALWKNNQLSNELSIIANSFSLFLPFKELQEDLITLTIWLIILLQMKYEMRQIRTNTPCNRLIPWMRQRNFPVYTVHIYFGYSVWTQNAHDHRVWAVKQVVVIANAW